MKKVFLLVLSLLLSGLTFSQNEKAKANVQKTQGLYIFNDCEPVCEYEIVERVKNVFTLSPHKDYESIKARLIKKALKEYPEAQALVLSLSSSGADNALVVKFKDGTAKEDWPKAIVNKEQGLFIFSDAEPSSDYEIIDRGKAGMTWSDQYSENKAKLVKKALKHHEKEAEGLIIDGDKSVIIKFK